MPYFWCDLGDWAKLEWVGLGEEWDSEVVRGSVEDGEFAISYTRGDKLVAALSLGRPEDLMAARQVLAGEAVSY